MIHIFIDFAKKIAESVTSTIKSHQVNKSIQELLIASWKKQLN